MRFPYDAYEKVYPKTEPAPAIDSAVEGYTPTAEDKGKAADVKPASEEGAAPAQAEEQPQPEVASQEDISQN